MMNLLHGRVGPVVGQCLDDAEAGAAVGAVGEGVAVATVGRVEHFCQAVGTGGDIGEDEDGLAALVVGMADLETA